MPGLPTRAGSGGRSRRRSRASERGTFTAVFLGDLCRAGVVLILLHVFVFNFSLVRGSSMRPNIEDGDRLLVDKLTYSILGVDRFDVVILACPKNRQVDYVKRIVGLPGDRIEFSGGQLFVNGAPVPQRFAHVNDKETSGVWHVPKGCYFVVGDNRPISSDSREGWFVAQDLIKGKVRACFWPLAHARTF